MNEERPDLDAIEGRVRQALRDRRVRLVSDRTGISTRTIYNIISGARVPRAATLMVLADYLGVREADR